MLQIKQVSNYSHVTYHFVDNLIIREMVKTILKKVILLKSYGLKTG